MCFWAQPLVCLIASPHSSRHPIYPCSTKNRLNLPDSARSFLMVTSVTASFVCFWKLVLTCAPGILSTIPLPATSSSLLTARSHPATAQRLLSNKWFNLVSGLCLLFESATVQSKKNIYSMLKKKLVDFKLNCVKEFNKSFFIARKLFLPSTLYSETSVTSRHLAATNNKSTGAQLQVSLK